MVQPRSSRRVLKSTVAMAAAGAVALAPMAPLAQELDPAALDPVAIRIGQAEGYARLEFAGVVGSRARVSVDGRRVTVRIGTTAAPDVSRLKVDPPAGVEKVETQAVQGGTDLIITLAEGAQARTGRADGAVWLNLYAPGQAPAPSTTEAAAPMKPVPVKAAVRDEALTLTFHWDQPVGAAVFRRGGHVWIVFDAAARLDMADAKALGPASSASSATWAAGPDYVAVRLAAPETLALSAASEASAWTVTLGGQAGPTGGVEVARDPAGDPRLVMTLPGARRAVWLTDPEIGDRFAAVTALAPAKGFGQRRRTVELGLIPTAHGLAIETAVADLSVIADGDLVTVSRPGGLTLSPPSAELAAAAEDDAAPKRAAYPALIDPRWGEFEDGGFLARRRALQEAAGEEGAEAAENPRAPAEKRLAYARFLLGCGLHYEALGVLNALVAAQPSLLGEAEVRGLRAAARVGVGRLEEAQADLSGASLAGDPSAQAWLGLIASERGQWDEARRAFGQAAAAVDQFPPEQRVRFASAHALAALETGDAEAARSLIAYALSQPVDAAAQLGVRLIQARMFETTGEVDRARAVYAAVAKAPLDELAVPARLGVVRIGLARGAISPKAAAQELEGLRWRWRGDAVELEVIRTLGQLYLSQGLYREALTVLRAAGPRIASIPGGLQLQADLQAAFRMLFLEGGADGMHPIQALGLFYDFRDLTPVGADGDEMVRRLARRLIDVDLLDQAAELLKHQVEERLDGVAQASVAADLATVYLMDRQPEPALQALWSTRTTLLPSGLQAERRALEARALMELGRLDHALEVLGADTGPAAMEVRAEILWKKQGWAAAGAAYERLLGDRWSSEEPLSALEESRLIRAGVGFSLAKDSAALQRLSGRWGRFVERARNPDALRVALFDPASLGTGVGLAEALKAGDTFTGWVEAARARFRERTGGTAPAAPPAQAGA